MPEREAIFEEFLIDQQIKGNSNNTLVYYRYCVFPFLRYLDSFGRGLSDLTVQDLKSYYFVLSSRGLSSVSVQSYMRGIRSFLSWCYSNGYTSFNILEQFKLPKAKRSTIDILTDSEVLRLFSCFKGRDFLSVRNFCICSLMFDSGLRLNEVVTLESSNLHVAEGYAIVTGKGDKQRIVPFGLQTKKALLRYISMIPYHCDKTPLFVKDDLTSLKQSTVKQLFRRLKVDADIPRLRPHLLRHTFATRYLERGGDVYSLQIILGHTSIEMSRKYVHLTATNMAVNFTSHSPLDNVFKK